MKKASDYIYRRDYFFRGVCARAHTHTLITNDQYKFRLEKRETGQPFSTNGRLQNSISHGREHIVRTVQSCSTLFNGISFILILGC